MKVFISWSGERSKTIAVALKDWLPCVIQSVKPWLSFEDVEKGSAWRSELAKELDQTSVGVFCCTPENIESPWLCYEAGAISKCLPDDGTRPRVCTYLFDIAPAEIVGPLKDFQHTAAGDKDDTLRMLRTLNAADAPDNRLDDAILLEVFEKWWPDLEKKLGSVGELSQEPPRRQTDSMIEETLELVRGIARGVARMAALHQLTSSTISASSMPASTGLHTGLSSSSTSVVEPVLPNPSGNDESSSGF